MNNHRVSRWITASGSIMLIFALLPGAFPKIYGKSESMKEGLLCASIISVLFVIFTGNRIEFARVIYKAKYLLLGFVFVVIHGIFMIFGEGFNTSRFLLSLGFVWVLAILWIPIASVLFKATDQELTRGIYLAYWSMLADGLFSSLVRIQTTERFMIFHSEPSHFALTFLPFVWFVVSKSQRRWHLVIGYLLSVTLPSVTLLFGVILIDVILNFRVLVNRLLFIVPTIAIAVNVPEFREYLEGRNIFDTDTESLSTLVFLSGFERAYNTILDGYWFGVGFQQMGFIGNVGDLMEVIRRIQDYDLNLLDGGTLAAKLLYEFGLFGLLLLLCYLYVFYFVAIRKVIVPTGALELFAAGYFVSFFCYLFVRGSGYMSVNVVLFLFSCVVLFTRNDMKRLGS